MFVSCLSLLNVFTVSEPKGLVTTFTTGCCGHSNPPQLQPKKKWFPRHRAGHIRALGKRAHIKTTLWYIKYTDLLLNVLYTRSTTELFLQLFYWSLTTVLLWCFKAVTQWNCFRGGLLFVNCTRHANISCLFQTNNHYSCWSKMHCFLCGRW